MKTSSTACKASRAHAESGLTMLALEVALICDRGGRKYNEDACGHWHSQQQLCCVLADGAGGHGGGDIASKLAVQELIGRFSHQPAAHAEELDRLLRVTNDVLISHRVPGTPKADMHSTVVCLVLDFMEHRALWAHAGDSRMYWFHVGVWCSAHATTAWCSRWWTRVYFQRPTCGCTRSAVNCARRWESRPMRWKSAPVKAWTPCRLAMFSCSAPTACGNTWTTS